MSKQKFTISKAINGTTLLIILISKYLFVISLFSIYSPTFRRSRFMYYSVASTNQAAFFIGGYRAHATHSSVIAKYENDEWSLHGNLKQRRWGHGSIISGAEILVFGGVTYDNSVVTEVWDLNGKSRIVDPTPENEFYAFGMGIYLVPSGYCSNQ